MRTLLFVIILFGTLFHQAEHQAYANKIQVKIQTNTPLQTTKLQHPPIPTENPQTEKIAIVTLQHPQSVEEILSQFPELELRYVFKHALNGFSVKGPIKVLEKLAKNQSNIINISPVNTYKTDETPANINVNQAKTTVSTDTSNLDIIGAKQIRGLFDEQNQRLTGKGVTVGVIDTGIDYRHPDLSSNYKGGRDFVDGDKDPMETKGIAGLSTIHGTHVAGIIAANGRMKGVAPEADIIAYRALGPGGSGTTEQVIAAIEQAIEDKVDVLNLSLGNRVNGPDLPISLALNKAVESGITAVTSSGNSGPNKWTVGAPGTATKAISVGASTPVQQIAYLQLIGKHNQTQAQTQTNIGKIKMEPLQGSISWTPDNRQHELIFAGLGSPDNLHQAEGKIVLIERGQLTFTEKAKNAVKAGAKAVIIFNNTKGSFMGNLDEAVNIPVMAVSRQDGLKLKQLCPTNAKTLLIEESDQLADFSSRGPVTVSWEIKPDVVAPGVAINSTIPGGYLELQGTSMAAPHVAGACALIKQAHPDWTPEQIKAVLMNTAKPIKNQSGKIHQTFEQGAGRIQIPEAIKTESIVAPGSLQFGKFNTKDIHHKHQESITVKNSSNHHQNYYFNVPKRIAGIEWNLPLSFQLKPNEEKQIDISMTVDPKHFSNKIYDGYLELRAESNTIRIPYLYVFEEPDYPRVMGFEMGMGDEEEIYRYEVYLPGGADEFGIALFEPQSMVFNGFLDWQRNVGSGLLEKEISGERLPEPGLYLAKVFAKKGGKEDMLETMIKIVSESEESQFQ
ncbi:S8 family serine peptidase [Bacillus marasmi]|uniref:S8 family serine peptidase n=1 Tax=Bacillus marasmi TaxID=1926279 RepID=UPI0011C84C38|nr:S8 family serine peptidase [Bacillus marasmi]